jgi:DNA-binding PadR family transcriptional regulator
MKVLNALANSDDSELSGADIHKLTHISSGTLYPILIRFEKAGWFTSEWEDVDPSEEGRPRRRLYRITPTGLTKANEVLEGFALGALA